MRAVLSTGPLGFPWKTIDPFLFCVHHDDAYPRGNAQLGPDASLAGRDLGMDFAGIDGWRMYHGRVVPGFPQHPHRGFETITILRKGFIDHSDSLGATARFGPGDVQWMTAGRGVVHSEMFPLLARDRPNPVELFQIWINLPAADKMVDPHFTMFWNHTIAEVELAEGARARVIAGRLGGRVGPPPPPRSWASRPESDVAISTITLAPGARCVLPAARKGTQRTLYLFRGGPVAFGGPVGFGGVEVRGPQMVRVEAAVDLELANGAAPADLLLLQGRPIGEPVAHHGPFVMNDQVQLRQAFLDYQRTRFGGWPWPSDDPVHARDRGRFARHADGRVEEADPRPAELEAQQA